MIKTHRHCKKKKCKHLVAKYRLYCSAHKKLSMKEGFKDQYQKQFQTFVYAENPFINLIMRDRTKNES